MVVFQQNMDQNAYIHIYIQNFMKNIRTKTNSHKIDSNNAHKLNKNEELDQIPCSFWRVLSRLNEENDDRMVGFRQFEIHR